MNAVTIECGAIQAHPDDQKRFEVRATVTSEGVELLISEQVDPMNFDGEQHTVSIPWERVGDSTPDEFRRRAIEFVADAKGYAYGPQS
jgi:hypothetical protein